MSSKSGQSNNMDKWVEDAKVRIKDFKKSHALQRVQLELAFETAPRDSRYSNGLIDMMRKEEVIIAKDPNSSVTKSVSQKVDENLRAETRGFFNKSVQKNAKRWAILKEKFDHETQQFARGLTTELKAFSNVKGSAPPLRVNHTPTAEELDEEADRLECDYNKNWYKYENFNLQEAFKSQNNRIENDWGAHERTLEEEFQARREKIAGAHVAGSTGVCMTFLHTHLSGLVPLVHYTDIFFAFLHTGPQYGRGASTQQSPAHAATHDPRWQHPEKQKTLIHTAPVLSPTKMQMGGSDASGWAKGKDQGAINQEVGAYVYPTIIFVHEVWLTNTLPCCTVGAHPGGVRRSGGGHAEAEGGREALAAAAAGAAAGAGHGGPARARHHRRPAE